jgi:hypothetical protein
LIDFCEELLIIETGGIVVFHGQTWKIVDVIGSTYIITSSCISLTIHNLLLAQMSIAFPFRSGFKELLWKKHDEENISYRAP